MFIVYINKIDVSEIKMRWAEGDKDFLCIWMYDTWTDPIKSNAGESHFDWIRNSGHFDILHFEQ